MYKVLVKFETLRSDDFLLRVFGGLSIFLLLGLMAQSNDAIESVDKEMTEKYYKYTYLHEKKTYQVT